MKPKTPILVVKALDMSHLVRRLRPVHGKTKMYFQYKPMKAFEDEKKKRDVAWLQEPNRSDNVKKIDKSLLVQPTGDVDELYELAEEARDGFKAWMEEVKTTLNASGLKSRKELKQKRRVMEKIVEDGATDASKMYDIDGHTLEFDDLAGVARAVKYFMSHGATLRLKNNYVTPAITGYRDINLNVKLPNGMISEVQVNTKAMGIAKDAMHVFYEIQRTALLTPEHKEISEVAIRCQQKVYAFAYDELIKGSLDNASLKASVFEIARPFWYNCARLLGTNTAWLPEKTLKTFHAWGSQPNGVSSDSKNSSSGLSKSKFFSSIMGVPPQEKHTTKGRAWQRPERVQEHESMKEPILVVKALNTSRLMRKQVSFRNQKGTQVQQMKWVRPNEAPKGQRRGHGQAETGNQDRLEDPRGADRGYGMHHIESGDSVEFVVQGERITGKVVDDTRHDGVIAQDSSGQKFPVPWKEIVGFSGQGGGGKPESKGPAESAPIKQRETVDPDSFTAATWKADYDDPNVTAAGVIAEMEKSIPGVMDAIEKTEARLKTLEQTISSYRIDGKDAGAVYSKERSALHGEILKEILSPERCAATKPLPGEKPVFIMLGGRGGSGKSWFKGQVYDPDKCIVLDADEIKGKLPEYEGYNAFQVHEESSDILEKALSSAREQGLNVVLDATMKTTKSAVKKVDFFKEAGYSFEAHYMHLPRQEAARRAIGRFMGKTKRYVPVDVILSNTTNEASFDEVRKMADSWSFRDNSDPGGTHAGPMLISQSGKSRFAKAMRILDRLRMKKGVESKYGRGRMEKSIERENASAYDEYDCGGVTRPEDIPASTRALFQEISKKANEAIARRDARLKNK